MHNVSIRRLTVLALLAAIQLPAIAGSGADVSPRVDTFMRSHSSSRIRVWIYLSGREASPRAEDVVSPRSLERRERRSPGPALDIHDVPVPERIVGAIAHTGAAIHHSSRYLNAVSATVDRHQLAAIRALPFVERITRVAGYRRRAPAQARTDEFEPRRAPGVASGDYGASRRQLDQAGIIGLHDDGLHGEGILIAVFDTGFNRRHEALDHLNVVAEWDFIFGDSVTENDEFDVTSIQHSHGTNTLSTVAGFAPGNLIGPAWAADVVLAKTERMFEEVEGEEDDFVRALEWADSIGVDIVTASLGYFQWYDYADMDGNTAVTTRACDIAASKGITIVTSIGNQGSGALPWPGVIAPADGDSVIAVGAVDSFGVVTSFSSHGPTFDGRIKPDVMAMGRDVRVASSADSLTYRHFDGTSFSAPLVAGACALLLQMHPGWGPMEVLNALRSEASNAAAPDNTYGWGIIDAYRSAQSGATGVLSGTTIALEHSAGDVIATLTNAGAETITVDLVRREQTGPSTWGGPVTIDTDLLLDAGARRSVVDTDVGAGVFEYRLRLSADPSQVSAWRRVKVSFAFSLGQSYPNPFEMAGGDEVTIHFSIAGDPGGSSSGSSSAERVELSIYNVRGALVRRLFAQRLGPGNYDSNWDGRGETGEMAASGVYFYRLSVGASALTRKIVLMRP